MFENNSLKIRNAASVLTHFSLYSPTILVHFIFWYLVWTKMQISISTMLSNLDKSQHSKNCLAKTCDSQRKTGPHYCPNT